MYIYQYTSLSTLSLSFPAPQHIHTNNIYIERVKRSQPLIHAWWPSSATTNRLVTNQSLGCEAVRSKRLDP